MSFGECWWRWGGEVTVWVNCSLCQRGLDKGALLMNWPDRFPLLPFSWEFPKAVDVAMGIISAVSKLGGAHDRQGSLWWDLLENRPGLGWLCEWPGSEGHFHAFRSIPESPRTYMARIILFSLSLYYQKIIFAQWESLMLVTMLTLSPD